MAKKDISKILSTGSAKQRLLLLAENYAKEKYNQESLLTDSEVNILNTTFKKPNEIRLWNKWLKIDRLVTTAIMNLQGLKFEVLMHYSNLRGYILVCETIKEAETLCNIILHKIEDREKRKETSALLYKNGEFLFSEIKTDKEGYLDLEIVNSSTQGYTLIGVMDIVKKQAIDSAIKFLSWREAILDFMEEEDFIIKTYRDIINSMRDDIYKPIFIFKDEKKGVKRSSKTNYKNSILPNIKELEIDTNIYNYFKTEFLKDE